MHILIASLSIVGSIKVYCCQSFKAWKKKLKIKFLATAWHMQVLTQKQAVL